MMFFNQSTTGDPRSFMYYKGDFYINGTEIIFSDEYIKNNNVNGKKIWPYARFDHKETNVNGVTMYYFARTKSSWLDLYEMGLEPKVSAEYTPFVRVEAYNVEKAIGEITHAIKLEREETEAILQKISEPKSEFDNPQVMLLWIIYIALMIGSLIFKQFYILWIIETYLFFKIKKDLQM